MSCLGVGVAVILEAKQTSGSQDLHGPNVSHWLCFKTELRLLLTSLQDRGPWTVTSTTGYWMWGFRNTLHSVKCTPVRLTVHCMSVCSDFHKVCLLYLSLSPFIFLKGNFTLKSNKNTVCVSSKSQTLNFNSSEVLSFLCKPLLYCIYAEWILSVAVWKLFSVCPKQYLLLGL